MRARVIKPKIAKLGVAGVILCLHTRAGGQQCDEELRFLEDSEKSGGLYRDEFGFEVSMGN
jgi:hypothetical protein